MSKDDQEFFATSVENVAAETKEKSGSQTLLLRKDIWTLIKEKDKKSEGEAPFETSIFFIGAKNAGKTSLIHRFLDRDEVAAPTVALEYTYGRRTRGTNALKDIAHIWELAGGTSLTDLLEIPLTESNVHLSTALIMLDLSKPAEMIEVLEHCMDKLRQRTNAILDRLEQKGSKRPKALKSYAAKKFGADHPDKASLDPITIPVVIVGNKYDALKDMESERRKLLCKTLRFYAHINGASLIFSSVKDESLISKSRQLISHYAFRTNALKTIAVDHSKPILVIAGQDTLSQIGLPPSEMSRGDSISRQAAVSFSKWKADYQTYFPPEKSDKQVLSVDLSKYPEPVIDALKAQKDEELEKLKRALDRKAKENISNLIHKEKRKGKAYSRAKASGMAPE